MFKETEVTLAPALERPPRDEDVREAIAARSDPRAFLTLYERYVTRVYRYCLVRLYTTSAAEDATSEVFLRALDRLAGYRGGSFVAWLFAIARNVVTDHYRRRRPMAPLDAAAGVADESMTGEGRAIVAERLRAVRSALQALSKEQRDLIELQLAGWDDPEISEALGKTRDAVKMLRYRAMKRLRDGLAKAGWDPRDWASD
jgi:RNA polymerase sigma-70 factor, ECF subfamily